MDSKAIRDRIAKAEDTIDKKQVLISKRFAQAKKLINALNKDFAGLGFEPFVAYEDCLSLELECKRMMQFYRENYKQTEDGAVENVWWDYYWAICKIDDIPESIKNAYDAINEKHALIAKYEAELAKNNEKELFIENLPQVIIQFRDEVCEMWDAWDLMRQASLVEDHEYVSKLAHQANGLYFENRDAYKAIYEEIDDIKSKYSSQEWSFLAKMTKEEIHEDNMKSANNLVMNLYYRVEGIVGDIEDASDLRVARGNQGCAVINGLVKGKEKTAKVQSVGAGGWNIQRFHIRTLVNEVKA